LGGQSQNPIKQENRLKQLFMHPSEEAYNHF